MNRLIKLLESLASVTFAIGGLIYVFSDKPIEGALFMILSKMLAGKDL